MNKATWRRLLAAAACLTLLFSAAACNKPAEGDASSSAPSGAVSGTGAETGGSGTDTTGMQTGGESTATGESGSVTSGKGNKPGPSITKTTNTTKTTKTTSGNGPSTDLGDGTTYYVSSSTGNDANDGKSEAKPFKTVAPVNNLTLKPGDNILFKRGDTFKGAHLIPKGSGEKTDKKWITIDAYGSGARPLFKDAAENRAAISLSLLGSYRGYRIRNIDVENYKVGIASMKPGLEAPLDGLRIENCSFTDITTNKGWQASPNLPEGAALAWGIVLNYVTDLQIKNVTTDNCESPIMLKGKDVLIDGLEAYNSSVQGMMVYGLGHGQYVLQNKSNIVLQNCKVVGTGRMGFHLGSTSLLMENVNTFTVKDSEFAYTVNGARAYDACAMDFENNNVNCTIDNVYAHDNDGPFLLAMEHPEEAESYGVSRNNVIKNCISVNNGRRDRTEEGSFINHSSYVKDYQKLTVQNCIDVGRPGSIPYTYENAGKKEYSATLGSRVKASGFTSGMADVYESFDEAGLTAFKSTGGLSVSNSHLALSSGAKARTRFSGSNYHVSTYLKGNADLVFLSSDENNGYVWDFQNGKIVAQKMVGGKLTKLKEIKASGLNPSNWFRVRVQTGGGQIKTYLNEVLVDTLKDTTFTAGSAGYNAAGAAQADELMVYSYTNKTRKAETNTVNDNVAPGGRLQFTGNYHETETSWKPSGGIGSYLFAPHGVSLIQLTGSNAMIEYGKNLSVKTAGGYNRLHILMNNCSTNNKITVEYKVGGNWYAKDVTVAAMSNDSAFPFNLLVPQWKNYTVDMTGAPGWGGEITGMRLKFHSTSGYVTVKRVVISK